MVIYKVTNLINNKIYVGQDSRNNPKYYGSGNKVQRILRWLGKEKFYKIFKKEILEENIKDLKELNQKERYWIKKLNATDSKIGYNISKGGGPGIPPWNKGLKTGVEPINKVFLNEIEKNKIVDLYLNENLTIREIAKRFNHKHHNIIARVLKEKNIKKQKGPRKGNIPWNKNKKLPELSLEHRIKISKANKGKTPWNKGITKWHLKDQV